MDIIIFENNNVVRFEIRVVHNFENENFLLLETFMNNFGIINYC